MMTLYWILKLVLKMNSGKNTSAFRENMSVIRNRGRSFRDNKIMGKS